MGSSENLFSFLPKEDADPHPWLLVSHGKRLQTHTFYNPSTQQYFETTLPEFHMKQVSWTSHGWLFIVDHSKHPQDCRLVNPAAPHHKIPLPPIELEPETPTRLWEYQCVLSKPPTDPDCHVLLLSASDRRYCRLGDENFNIQGQNCITSATSLNGKIYACVDFSSSLVEVEFVGQHLLFRELIYIPRVLPPNWMFFNSYLAEYSCNEVLLVYMICYPHSRTDVAYFRTFKLNPQKQKCEELTSIGNRTIFLGSSGSISFVRSTDKIGFKKETIYYERDDANLYVYDINHRSKTILKPCPMVTEPKHFRSWIVL